MTRIAAASRPHLPPEHPGYGQESGDEGQGKDSLSNLIEIGLDAVETLVDCHESHIVEADRICGIASLLGRRLVSTSTS